MANDLIDLRFQDHAIRCWGTDRDLWFVAKDVCEALGIAWRGNETLVSIPEHWRGVRTFRTRLSNQHGDVGFQQQDLIVINEPAIYKLAFRSNKPDADAFTNWVASEVLPQIRRTGSYRAKERQRYLGQGKAQEWIEEREEGIQERKHLTDTLQEHGVEGRGYADCTNAITSA